MIVSIVHTFLLGVLVDKWSTQAQEHIGCFHWTGIQPILTKPAFIPNQDDENVMTIDLCIERCKTMFQTTYAGIRGGYNCRCGDRFEHGVDAPQLNDTSCTSTCPGDQRSKCGGANSMVIYSDFTFVTGDRTLMADAVTHSASTGVTVDPTTTLVSPLGTDPAKRIYPNTNDNIPVTAIAVGVSVVFVFSVVIAAFIAYFRKRGHTRKSGDSPIEATSIQEVIVDDIHNKDDLTMEQPVVYENVSPAHDDGKDIAKSDDDIVIHDDQEKEEYEVLSGQTNTKQANLKENSLYEKLRI